MIKEDIIGQQLCNSTASPDAAAVLDILSKAKELKGLNAQDIAVLSSVHEPDMLAELFQAARHIKEEIYGQRMVIFSPLYISNLCQNECLYCAFRAKNKSIKRRSLNQDEIRCETEILIN